MWWAAQVANNKEYDTKREIIREQLLDEDDILIPRIQVYEVHGDNLKKKTETMMPGYILLNLDNKKKLSSIENISNYIRILGMISNDEMSTIKEHENIPEDPGVDNGDKIIVTRGPLMGVKGNIVERHKSGKYKCKLVFHGNEITVDLEPNIIEKIS